VRDIVNSRARREAGQLKSSTTFVRNAPPGHRRVLHKLRLTEAIQVPSATSPVEGEDKVERDVRAYVNETNEAVMAAAIAKAGKHPSVMNREEKLEFIRILDEEGAFLIKGMVNYVAKTLSVTIYTVYNYLRQIKGSQR
jgi:predicted transcriptional regulator YheO